MEPTPQQVILHTTIIDAGISVGEIPVSTYFQVLDIPAKIWLEGHTCPFNTGDRVKITITKEPSNATTTSP